MELVPIQPGMFLVPGANNGQYPFSHSVLIDSEVVCLIDAGCGLSVLEQVQEVVTPDLIVASHAHPDPNCVVAAVLSASFRPARDPKSR